MKTNIQRVIVFFAILLLPIPGLFSQNISHMSVGEGLPQSFVSGIVEDEEGFVWVSTRNGLARFDGNEFIVFQHRVSDYKSLASNIITCLRKGVNNTLWIKYETGAIDKIDMRSQKIEHVITSDFTEKHRLPLHIGGWLVSADSTFWCLTKKQEVYSFRWSDEKKIKKNYYGQKDAIRALLEDSEGTIWFLSQSELVKTDPKTKKNVRYTIPYKQNLDSISSTGSWDDIMYLHERSNGELMWTDKSNIYFFNPGTRVFRKSSLPFQLDNTLKHIYTGPDHKDYFVAQNSLYSYDEISGIVERAKIPTIKTLHSLLVDQSGLIWIGADTKGIFKIDLTTNFNVFRYEKDFAFDLLEKEFDIPVYNFFKWNPSNKGPLRPAYYIRSIQDDNKLWIALNRTVCYYDFQEKKIKKLPDLPLNHKAEGIVPIKGIALTNEGNPMVIDEDNILIVYDEKEGWKTSSLTVLLEGKYKPLVPNALLADDSGLWITTESEGLLYIDTSANRLTHIKEENEQFKFPANSLLNIIQDVNNKNILWIASYQGLIRFEKDIYKSEIFSIEEGLPDNVIYSILPDPMGNLWLGTNKGLCRFDVATHKTRIFSTSHGLPFYEFNRFHQLLLPHGEMAFGGIDSGIIFNPASIYEDDFKPKTAITGIRINNKEIHNNKEQIPLNSLADLVLPYNENTINIEFSALQFSYPKDILYRYRLRGYDDEWVMSGNKREAVYTKIPPGNYILEINATNTTGIWSDHIKQLSIKILPPWWRTWWAIVLYICIIILGTVFYINFRISQEVMKNKIALKKKEAKQLRKIDEMKTRFFSNITHELRTPLSLIMGPAELLKKIKDEEERQKLLSVIIRNADSLLNLTNQLLDIAKIEAGALKPHMVWGDVVAVIKKTMSAFSEASQSKNIKIKLVLPVKAEYFFSQNTLERIIYNLVSNALKFSTEGGQIVVTLQELTDGIMIEVKDNGKGIPGEDLPNIFKRFYKGSGKKQISGTGIGLSLVKELVELHKGRINVTSSTRNPAGTSFVVFLPFEKSVPGESNNEAVFEEIHEKPEISDSVEFEEKPIVLIVEDNHELATFVSDSLKSLYTIFWAQNGEEGLQLALDKIPDLIISDVLMDGMDGFEFCKALKKDINTSHIPTILLTAKSDMESKLEGLSYGADDYITKPFSISELLLRIENKLELQKRQREHLYKSLKQMPYQGVSLNQESLLQDEFLNKIYSIVDSRIDDEAFNVEELASELGMSRTSLHRKAKTVANMSAGEVIKTYRLQKAILFLHENFNISEAAYKTGFGSPSYFTKCFRETYGMTPTEYLQKGRLKPES